MITGHKHSLDKLQRCFAMEPHEENHEHAERAREGVSATAYGICVRCKRAENTRIMLRHRAGHGAGFLE